MFSESLRQIRGDVHVPSCAARRRRSYPIIPSSGPPEWSKSLSLTQDITERKRAHELIRQERDRAQSYLDVADVILLALDVHGRITLINRKGCATLGREERELLGRDWIETCLPPE